MAKIITLDITEIKRLKLNINEYLTLLNLNSLIEYNFTDHDIGSLQEKGYIKVLSNGLPILTERSVKYFESIELFEKFYNIFPHKVPGRFGEERPLRNESIDSNGASVTKSIFKSKTKGNQILQNRIIEVVEAEIQWRANNNSLQYMHNIDTWLRQHDWEKYEYLLEETSHTRKLL